MDNHTYLKESERTEKKLPEGVTIERRLLTAMILGINAAEQAGMLFDDVKKHLIYEADPSNALQELMAGVTTQEDDAMVLNQDKAEVLHAAMGVLTESMELATALFSHALADGELDVPNIVEEIGDIDFYTAMLMRQLGITREQTNQVNIDKLKARYPDKFDGEKAINRDLDKERQILEDGAQA